MKLSIHKFLAIILCGCMILAFAACKDNENKPVEPVVTEQPTEPAPVPEITPEPIPAVEVEIIDSLSVVYHNDKGVPYARSYIIGENRGDKDAYIGSVTFDLERADGTIIDTIPFLTAFPNSVKPGEKFVVYADNALYFDTDEETLHIYPTFTSEELKSELRRLEIVEADGIASFDKERGFVTCNAKVKNPYPEMISLYFVCATFYDKDDHAILQFNQVFTDGLASGVEVDANLEGNVNGIEFDPEQVVRIEYVAAPYVQIQN